MPIYAYKCESCGFAKDVLQKMSDPQLVDCPECGAASFKKQLTSAGFQLKGTGWYVTDFRGADKAAGAASPNQPNNAGGSDAPSAGASSSDGAAAAAPAAAPSPAVSAPAPSPAPSAPSGAGTPKTS